MWRWLGLGLVLLLIVACEPLAPEPQSAPVIIITTTPPLAPTGTPTSPLAFAPSPTASPTQTPVLNPTATLPPCNQSEGIVFEMSFSSAIVGAEIPYNVYLPPCYALSGRRYPYVILLHGSNTLDYDYTQWTGGIQVQVAMELGLRDPVSPLTPMILIMPEGGDLQEANIFDAGISFEDVILNELIPNIEDNFCVWGTPSGRAIGGISRGGFWAMSIALRHPDQFVAIGGHSPWFVADNAPPAYNPLNLATTVQPTTPLRIYLDNARNDTGGVNVVAFSDLLRANGVLYEYDISATGGHDNAYWQSKARDYLNFYSRQFSPNRVEFYPTCFE